MDEEEDKRIIQPGQRAQPKPAENQAPKAPALPPLPQPPVRGGMGRARVAPVRTPTAQERANLLVQDLRQMSLQAEEQTAFFNNARTRAILDEVEARVSDPTQKDGATYTEDVFLPRKLAELKEMAGSGASPDDLMAWAKKELPAPYRPTDWEHRRRVWEYATVEGNAARLQNKAQDYLTRLYGMSSKDAWEKTRTAESAAQVISDTENALERYAADNSFELAAESAIRGFMGPAIVKAWESLGDLTTPQAQMKAREVQQAFMQEAMMYRQKRLSDAGWMGTIEEIFADVIPSLPRQLGAQVAGALVGGTLGGGAAMGLVSAADAKILGAPQHQIRREAMKGTVLGVFGSLGERGVIAASMKFKGAMPSLMARFLGTGAVSVASEYGVAKATGEEYTLKDAVSSFLLEGAFASAETSPQAQRNAAWKAYSSGEEAKILDNRAASAAKMIEQAAGRPLTEQEFFGFYDAQSKVKSGRFRAEIMGNLATQIANERVAQQEAAQRLVDAHAKFMAEREQRRQAERRGFGSLDEEAVANIGMQEGVPLETGGTALPMSEEELSQRLAAGTEQFEAEAAPLPPGKARLSMQETDVVGDVEDVGGKPSVRIAPYQLTAIRQTPDGVVFGEMYRGTAGDERASGTWWADSRKAAKEYAESSGGKVYKAEVVLKRPFFAIDDAGRAELERLTGISEQDGLMETKEQWMSALEQAGYDGLVIDDTSETVDKHLTVVPFRGEGVRYAQSKRGLGGKKEQTVPTEPVGLGRGESAPTVAPATNADDAAYLQSARSRMKSLADSGDIAGLQELGDELVSKNKFMMADGGALRAKLASGQITQAEFDKKKAALDARRKPFQEVIGEVADAIPAVRKGKKAWRESMKSLEGLWAEQETQQVIEGAEEAAGLGRGTPQELKDRIKSARKEADKRAVEEADGRARSAMSELGGIFKGKVNTSESIYEFEGGSNEGEFVLEYAPGSNAKLFLRRIESFEAGSGAGTRMLRQIKEVAGKFGASIEVQPDPFGQTLRSEDLGGPTRKERSDAKRRLIRWYEREGFVKSGGGMMLYTPIAQAPSAATPPPAETAGLGRGPAAPPPPVPPAPARGMGGARRGKKAAPPAGAPEGRPAPVAAVAGARSQVPVQGGAAQDVRYAVMEMADIKPSNDPTAMFAATPGYPTENRLQERDYANDPTEQGKVRANAASLRPDEIINTAPSATTGPSIVTPDGTVINGNSRAMSLKLAAASGNTAEYRRVLIERASQFGIDPESIKGMREPVLVRVVDMDPRSEAAAVFGRQGNITATQAVSPTKRAGRYVRLIDDEILDAINAAPDSTISEILNNPQVSRPFREALIRSLPPSEVPEFFNADKSFTVAGQELAQNILLMKAIPQEVVERMSPELRRTVSQSVPQLAQMVRTEGMREASDAFVNALDVLIGPMRNGAISPEVLMGQDQMFGEKPQLSGIERMMLDFVYRERGASRRMRDRLAALITSQEQAGLMPEPLNEMMARSLEVEERPMGGERMSVGRAGEGMEGAMPPSDPGFRSARAWAEQNLVPHLRAKPRPLRERFGSNPTPEQRAQHGREMAEWASKTNELRDQLVDRIIRNRAEAETLDTVRTNTKIDRLARDLKDGKITQDEFSRRVSEQMDAEMARREVDRARKATGTRIRGYDRVMEVLHAASRRGEITPEMVDIAGWLLSQNPELADDLAVRVIERGAAASERGYLGKYSPAQRLVTLFKGIGDERTVAHEILHHLERFMPAPMRAAIRAEYLAQLDRAIKAANADLAGARSAGNEEAATRASNLVRFLDSISQYHQGGNALLLDKAVEMLASGLVDTGMYRLTQPSEFWAEDGSRILNSRYGASGIWARIRQWLREFAQKVKSVFGARSDAPVIRAMDYILKQSGAVETTRYGLGGRARTGDIYASRARAEQQGGGAERFSVAAGGVPPEAGGGDSPVEGGEAPEGPGPGPGLGATRVPARSGPPAGSARRFLQDTLGESGGVLRGKGGGLGDRIYEKIKMGVARGREIRAGFSEIASKVTRQIAGKRVERTTQQAFEHDGSFYYRWNAMMKGLLDPKGVAEENLRNVAVETSARMWNEAAMRLGTRLGVDGEEIMKTLKRGRTLPHDFHDYLLDVMMDVNHPDRQVVAQYIADATNKAIAKGEIPPRKAKKSGAHDDLPLLDEDGVDGGDGEAELEGAGGEDGLVTAEDALAYFAEVANQLSPTRPVTGAEGHLASEFSREWRVPDLIPSNMVARKSYRHYGSGGFVPLQKPALGQRLLTLIDRTARIVGAQIEFGRGAKGWEKLLTAEQKAALEAVQGSVLPTGKPVPATDKDKATLIGSMSVAWINDNMDELIGANIVPSLRKRYIKAEGGLEQAGQDFDGAMRTAFGRPYWGGRGRLPLTTFAGKVGRTYDAAANLTRSIDLLSASALNAIEALVGPSVSESVQGAPPLMNLPMGALRSAAAFPGSLTDALSEVALGVPLTPKGRALVAAGEVPPYISDRSKSIYDRLFARGLTRVSNAFRFLNSVAARMQSYQSARTNPITGDMKKFLAKWTGKNAFNTELMAMQIAQRAGVDLDQARAFVRGEMVDGDQADRIWRMARSRSASITAGEGIEVSESSKFAQLPFIQRLFTFWRWHDNYVRRNAQQLRLGASAALSGGIGRRFAGASRIGNTVLMASINAVIAKIAYLYWFGDDDDVEREWRDFEENPYTYFSSMLMTQLLAGPLGTLIRTAGSDVVSSAAFLPGRIKKKGDAVVNIVQGMAEQAMNEPEGEARFLKGLEDFTGATKAWTGGEGGRELGRLMREQRRRERGGMGLQGMPPMPGFGPR